MCYDVSCFSGSAKMERKAKSIVTPFILTSNLVYFAKS